MTWCLADSGRIRRNRRNPLRCIARGSMQAKHHNPPLGLDEPLWRRGVGPGRVTRPSPAPPIADRRGVFMRLQLESGNGDYGDREGVSWSLAMNPSDSWWVSVLLGVVAAGAGLELRSGTCLLLKRKPRGQVLAGIGVALIALGI